MSDAVAYAQLSDIGRHRETNEDASLASPPLFAVADGMGGAKAGEVASRLAVEALDELVDREADDGEEAEASLARAAGEANRRIFTAAGDDGSLSGMGTTLTALLIRGEHGHLAHIGDSRAYLLRGGELKQLTEDHSLVAEMVREGRLTTEGAAAHPMRSVLSRALGTESEVEVDLLEVELRADDVLLLCSDGLSGPVSEDKVRKALRLPDPVRAARRLVDEALRAGGPDNITVVVVRLSADDGPAARMQPLAPETPTAAPPAPAAPEEEAPAKDSPQPGSEDQRRRRWWPWSVRCEAAPPPLGRSRA